MIARRVTEIEPSTGGLKVVHLAPCDAEAHYDTPRNTMI
jgi:hypothetical protein